MFNLVTGFLLILVITSSLPAQPFKLRQELRESEQSDFVYKNHVLKKAPTPNQRLFDITSYQLNLDLYPDQFLLEGAVTIDGKCLGNGLDHIEIDFYQVLTVDSILQEGLTIPFDHQNNLISIPLHNIINNDESFSVTIYYHGNPQEGIYQSFVWGNHSSLNTPIIWTLSEPYGSPVWWPCKDDPNDKADSVFINVSVPPDLIVASNGILKGVSTRQDGLRTYHWKTGYPISTYLVSLAISNYAQFSDWYIYSPSDSMEVTYFVYPELLNAAIEDLSITVEMIEFFASVFGEYPFINEKYGMAIFPWSGGMEHQTITSYGSGLIWGNHRYDFINAHELAHQWFGDCITMRHWSQIWLNEGFASYAEALWFEHVNGKAYYHTYVNQWDQIPLNAPLFVKDSLNESALFSRTVYDKGALVLHMLRGVLGDTLFFKSLKAYASDPHLAYKSAVTEDFQRVCESVSGSNLEYFFQQWVYGSGRPNYKAIWWTTEKGSWETTLEITQINTGLFKMPLQIVLSGPSIETSYTVWDSMFTQRFQFVTDEKPDKLEIDPDNWVLKTLMIESQEFSVSQNYPNPFYPETHIDVLLLEDGKVIFEIFNTLGEKVYEETAYLSSGHNTFIWRGETNQKTKISSGIYFYRIRVGSKSITKKMILLK